MKTGPLLYCVYLESAPQAVREFAFGDNPAQLEKLASASYEQPVTLVPAMDAPVEDVTHCTMTLLGQWLIAQFQMGQAMAAKVQPAGRMPLVRGRE